MSVLVTTIDPRNPTYLENRSTMLERLADLESALEAARAGGGEKWVTRHHARGKLLPRERIEMLLDQDTPFLELSPVAAWGSQYPVGASVVTGIGVIEGVECVLVANDPTIDGGAVNPYTEEKIRRAARIAAVNRLPLVNLVESAGTPSPAGTPPGGAIARDLSRLTAGRVPMVSVVFGETSGDAAYLPALSDYTIMVRGHTRGVTVPPRPARPAAANGHPGLDARGLPGEPTDALGFADQLAEDERDGLRLARQCVRRFNWRKYGPAPRTTLPAPPRYDAEDLLTVVGGHPGGAFEPREVLARILDDSDFDEFKPGYGPGVVTGWGELHGYPLGIVAADGGGLTAADTQKAVHFIQLANATATSLLFLEHTTGSGEAPAAEDTQPDAPLVHAIAGSKVPHLTLSIGSTAVPAADGIRGRAYEPRFLFAWPVERPGTPPGARGAAPHPARQLQDDGVIDPRDTRTVLGLCLSAIHSASVEGAGHLGVYRP